MSVTRGTACRAGHPEQETALPRSRRSRWRCRCCRPAAIRLGDDRDGLQRGRPRPQLRGGRGLRRGPAAAVHLRRDAGVDRRAVRGVVCASADRRGPDRLRARPRARRRASGPKLRARRRSRWRLPIFRRVCSVCRARPCSAVRRPVPVASDGEFWFSRRRWPSRHAEFHDRYGIETFKVKVGREVDLDMRCVVAVRDVVPDGEAVRRRQPRLDAGAGPRGRAAR